jgi:hypothetical protein
MEGWKYRNFDGKAKRVLLNGFCAIVCVSQGLGRVHADLSSFFDEANRISAPEYIPVEADVLRARTKTTGIYETRFTMGSLSIQ